jgi:hypothetical protein
MILECGGLATAFEVTTASAYTIGITGAKEAGTLLPSAVKGDFHR